MADDHQTGHSPFHKGEQRAQERHGVRGKVEETGRRFIRDHMPDQHREFYQNLPFLLAGTVDVQGRPWASLIAGRPGFIKTPDAQTLEINTEPLHGDPLAANLKSGTDIGILGIDPSQRRRNRLTGRIDKVGDNGFSVTISQTFGNCPQYIQSRALEFLPEVSPTHAKPVTRTGQFDDNVRSLIENADTLFIATAYAQENKAGQERDAAHGADVSHRGGKPGFVRIEDDRSFVFPDFSGNNHFNTVGNILENPKAGFLFIDFETRNLVYLTGTAEIIWEGLELQAFESAERLIRFQADEIIKVEKSLPFSFKFGDYAAQLDRTGTWREAFETLNAQAENDRYRPYRVEKIERESATISSFYLRPSDAAAPARHEPGQFLPIRLTLPGETEPTLRTYTVSNAPGSGYYRLSIKREGGEALISQLFHDQVARGFEIDAMAPRGKFKLDPASLRPIVLISAGVGITPMIAMADTLFGETPPAGEIRPVYFIHGARNGKEQAFGDHLHSLADRHDAFRLHIRYSAPAKGDILSKTHHSQGRVDIALLKQILPFDDYDFYLCGPNAFMQQLYDGLTGMGIGTARIHYESFGPATVLKQTGKQENPGQTPAISQNPVKVGFSKSDIEAEWNGGKGTLLEFAEAAGLTPEFSCRSGICGSCATKLICGNVDYIEDPIAPHENDEVLICCSTPRSAHGQSGCGEDHGVILEL